MIVCSDGRLVKTVPAANQEKNWRNDSMRQHFRGVIWPRGSEEGEVRVGKRGKAKAPVYRYVVVGMIVTDEPVTQFEGKNEIFLDGPDLALIQPFTRVKSRKMKFKPGDASGVLLSLGDL